jgi:hypothetical protein
MKYTYPDRIPQQATNSGILVENLRFFARN